MWWERTGFGPVAIPGAGHCPASISSTEGQYLDGQHLIVVNLLKQHSGLSGP